MHFREYPLLNAPHLVIVLLKEAASGATSADNPHPSDTADHLAWENGWFEALDEDVA